MRRIYDNDDEYEFPDECRAPRLYEIGATLVGDAMEVPAATPEHERLKAHMRNLGALLTQIAVRNSHGLPAETDAAGIRALLG